MRCLRLSFFFLVVDRTLIFWGRNGKQERLRKVEGVKKQRVVRGREEGSDKTGGNGVVLDWPRGIV